MEYKDRKSIIGWNWGYYTLDDKELKFDVKGSNCFSLPYTAINLATATSKNEVAIELDNDNVKERYVKLRASVYYHEGVFG